MADDGRSAPVHAARPFVLPKSSERNSLSHQGDATESSMGFIQLLQGPGVSGLLQEVRQTPGKQRAQAQMLLADQF